MVNGSNDWYMDISTDQPKTVNWPINTHTNLDVLLKSLQVYCNLSNRLDRLVCENIYRTKR